MRNTKTMSQSSKASHSRAIWIKIKESLSQRKRMRGDERESEWARNEDEYNLSKWITSFFKKKTALSGNITAFIFLVCIKHAHFSYSFIFFYLLISLLLLLHSNSQIKKQYILCHNDVITMTIMALSHVSNTVPGAHTHPKHICNNKKRISLVFGFVWRWKAFMFFFSFVCLDLMCSGIAATETGWNTKLWNQRNIKRILMDWHYKSMALWISSASLKWFVTVGCDEHWTV